MTIQWKAVEQYFCYGDVCFSMLPSLLFLENVSSVLDLAQSSFHLALQGFYALPIKKAESETAESQLNNSKLDTGGYKQ